VLWKIIDVLALIVAIGLIVMLGPDVLSMKHWRKRLTRSLKRQDSESPSEPS
jgi:hypothetical protein